MISTQFAWLLLQVMSYAGLCHPGHKLPSVQIPKTHNSAMDNEYPKHKTT